MATAPEHLRDAEGAVPYTEGSDGGRQRSKLETAKVVADILSSAYGTHFAEYSGDSRVNGYYDPDSRTAYINRNGEEPVLGTISHELLHDLKVNDRAAFERLRQVVRNDMNLTAFSQYQESLLATYDEIGKDYSHMSQEELEEHVIEEAMADLCAEVMRDPTTITRIAEQDRSLARKIIDKLEEIISRIQRAFAEYFGGEDAEIRGLVNDFEEVKLIYQEVLANTARKGSQTDGTVGGEIKNSIQTLPDGKKYVQADRQVISGDDPKVWAKQVETYINEKIRKGQNVAVHTEDGDTVLLTEQTAGKAGYYNQNLPTDQEYATKLRAETHIDELAQTSVQGNKPPVPDADGRHGDFAKYGWEYRTAYFMDQDGKYYYVGISTALNDDGKVVYNIGSVRKRNNPVMGSSAPKGGALGGTVSTNSIPQDGGTVNSNLRKNNGNDTPTDNPLSVRRKDKAAAALKKYHESGDERDLPDKNWTRSYVRDTRSRSRYLLNQRLNLDYEMQYADAESRARIEAAIALLEKKIKAASEDEKAAADLQDILDNTTLNRNIALAPVIDELVDTDKGLKLKNGNYRYNDFYRNMERFFGKHFHLVKPLLDGFDGSKGDYARAQVEILTDMRQAIVKELGIKKGSKESKAVQWIAEKERNPRTKEEIAERERKVKQQGLTGKAAEQFRANYRVPYDMVKLYNEFGKEQAEKILQAEQWFRRQYDKLIDEINRTQKMIYPNRPDKQLPKRRDYMRHFREMETGFRGLMNIAGTDHNISPGLVLVSEHTQPKEKWASIKQEREGRATDEGAIEGFLDYLPQATYAIYINPYIDKFRGLARDIAELKGATGDSSANGFIKYLNDFAGHVAGKSDSLDRAIIDRFGSGGRKVVKGLAWFNNRVKSNAVLSNIGSVAKQVMNLPNGVELLHNPARIFQGIADVVAGLKSNTVQENYRKSDFLTERFLGKSFSQFDKNGLSKGVQWLLSAADEFGTRVIWNAAYREGAELAVKGELDQTPERYADILTRRAVAGRGVGEVPLAYQSQLGKLVLPFQIEVSNTWNVKRDVLQGRAKSWGEKSTSLERASREAIGCLVTWALGLAVTALTGSKGTFDPLGDILDGIMQGWEEEKEGDLFDRIVKMGQRVVQNVSGDFMGSRSYGWVVGELLGLIDEDWATTYFNDSVYQSQGVNVPAVQSAVKAAKDFTKGDNIGGIAELFSSFITPYGGKQLDKSIRGIADYVHGGKYQNDIYKELSTGERGDKRYDIPKTPGNLVRSALFGPSAVKAGDEYWEGKKLEGYAQSEQQKAANKARRSFVKEYDKAHPDSEVERLYKEVKDFSVYPYSGIKEVQKFTSNKKEHVISLLPAELEKYQKEQNERMQAAYEEVLQSSAYKRGDTEAKLQLLEDARTEAETTVTQLIQNDYLYKSNKAYSRLLTEGEHKKRMTDDAANAETYTQHVRASELVSYIKAAERDRRMTPEAAKQLQKVLDSEQKPTALDEELYRLEELGAGVEVLGDAYGLFSFSKNNVEYRIKVPGTALAGVFVDAENRLRQAMERVIATRDYKDASVVEKKKLLSEAKKDVRAGLREELKARYGAAVDDDFAKMMRMK